MKKTIIVLTAMISITSTQIFSLSGKDNNICDLDDIQSPVHVMEELVYGIYKYKIPDRCSTLNLQNHQFWDEGAKALADELQNNKTLKSLNITNCRIYSIGTTAILKALQKNTTLKELYMGKNPIDINRGGIWGTISEIIYNLNIFAKCKGFGSLAIAETLKTNTTLQKLILDGNGISKNCQEILLEAWKSNSTNRKELSILHQN